MRLGVSSRRTGIMQIIPSASSFVSKVDLLSVSGAKGTLNRNAVVGRGGAMSLSVAFVF